MKFGDYRKKRLVVVAVLAGLFITLGIDSVMRLQASLRSTAVIEATESERLAGPGDDHIPLVMIGDSAGLMNPVLYTPADSKLPLDARVIGVEVDGEAIAYSMAAMSDGGPHIISSAIGSKRLSVTYCSIVGCARVLEEESTTQPKLRFGGQDENLQMVFMYEGRRYGQSSRELPMKDAEHTVTTLGKWLEMHPDSKIFAGQPYTSS
ncbi:MAG TPA: hypothetical protein DDW52_03885 [Planctomycetaceae bacterium]|nr:hypothetical protein [Planctomycetaceae bacterium]